MWIVVRARHVAQVSFRDQASCHDRRGAYQFLLSIVAKEEGVLTDFDSDTIRGNLLANVC